MMLLVRYLCQTYISIHEAFSRRCLIVPEFKRACLSEANCKNLRKERKEEQQNKREIISLGISEETKYRAISGNLVLCNNDLYRHNIRRASDDRIGEI